MMASYLYSPSSSSRSSSESSNLDNTSCCMCTVQCIMIYTPERTKNICSHCKVLFVHVESMYIHKGMEDVGLYKPPKRRKGVLEKKKSQGFPPQMGTLESHKNL